jgi:DNA-binding NarL/FixJ family response regulator
MVSPFPFEKLTPRQKEVCALYKDGLSIKEIAEKLNIKSVAVYANISRSLKKLGLNKPLELIRGKQSRLDITRKQIEVIKNLSRLGSASKVAYEMGISTNTVNLYMHNVYKLLGLGDSRSKHNSLVALRTVLKAGLITIEEFLED